MSSAYDSLTFSTLTRPYYYSNFVSSIDGKVQVLVDTQAYWPLGSDTDYETLIDLRTYADVLIHGKNTSIPHPTVKSLSKDSFKEARRRNEKQNPIWYVVISNHPDESLIQAFENPAEHVKTFLITPDEAIVPESLEASTTVIRIGEKEVDLRLLNTYFGQEGKNLILVEGGPHLLGSYFKEDLIDEVFLTITPKIIGNKKEKTLTMVEGFLFSPEKVKHMKLFSVKRILDEVYLRYRK